MIDDDNVKAILQTYSQQVVWIPIIGLLLGILYNVGYFSEFGIGYFGVFSLSEHIVFAFQALPLALALMFFTGVLGLASATTPLRPLWIAFSIILGLSAVGMSIAVGHWITAFIFVTFAGIGSILYRIQALTAFARIIISIFIVGCCALALGEQAGRDATTGHLPYTLQYGTSKITGNLLRAGDKAVLFFNAATRTLELIRWSDIKEITRSKD